MPGTPKGRRDVTLESNQAGGPECWEWAVDDLGPVWLPTVQLKTLLKGIFIAWKNPWQTFREKEQVNVAK